MPKFWIQSSLGSSKHGRMRRRRLPDPRPILEGVRGPIYIRKAYSNLESAQMRLGCDACRVRLPHEMPAGSYPQTQSLGNRAVVSLSDRLLVLNTVSIGVFSYATFVRDGNEPGVLVRTLSGSLPGALQGDARAK